MTNDLIARLDAADRLPGAERLRTLSYDLLGAGPGTSVVDVGCGAGRAVAELATRGVRAVGVDPDERTIAVARGRWPEADFRIAGAYELPLPDASMEGYRADKVFHDLAAPVRALERSGEALRAARTVPEPHSLPPTWRARFHVDRAIAHVNSEDDDGATRALLAAETAAPEWMRYHATSRRVVAELRGRERRRTSPVTELANRLRLDA